MESFIGWPALALLTTEDMRRSRVDFPQNPPFQFLPSGSWQLRTAQCLDAFAKQRLVGNRVTAHAVGFHHALEVLPVVRPHFARYRKTWCIGKNQSHRCALALGFCRLRRQHDVAHPLIPAADEGTWLVVRVLCDVHCLWNDLPIANAFSRQRARASFAVHRIGLQRIHTVALSLAFV